MDDGKKINISEEANVYIAAHIAKQIRLNTSRAMDDMNLEDSRRDASYLHKDFDERQFRDKYFTDGTKKGNKWLDYEAASDTDHYLKKGKRANLIDFFSVDAYLTTHLFGEYLKDKKSNKRTKDEEMLNGSITLLNIMD